MNEQKVDCSLGISELNDTFHRVEKENIQLKKINREIMVTADRRVKALEQLLIFYRIGKYPSEKAFNELEVAKRKWEKLKAKAEGEVGNE